VTFVQHAYININIFVTSSNKCMIQLVTAIG